MRMAQEQFVPVVADDWYQRRRQDDEGEFFRAVADQGPRKGEGGSTRQGIYCFTADGRLLAYKNAGQAPDVMRDTLRSALRAWQKLPAEGRKPGAVEVPGVTKEDEGFVRTPPKNGLILKVYARLLDRNDRGEYVAGACDVRGADRAARDHLWLTEAEWKGLIPAEAKVGGKHAVPEAVARRLAQFHLIDNTRGEPPLWRREDVRTLRMELTAEEASARTLRLRLDGTVLLAERADAAAARRGYDARLLGYVHFNREKQAVERFDLAAIGDHWGEGQYTRGARPGRKPLGVAFELTKGETPADRVPPQGARTAQAYFATGP